MECVSFGLSRRNHRGHNCQYARYDEKTGKFQRTKEWVLDTDGVPHPIGAFSTGKNGGGMREKLGKLLFHREHIFTVWDFPKKILDIIIIMDIIMDFPYENHGEDGIFP